MSESSPMPRRSFLLVALAGALVPFDVAAKGSGNTRRSGDSSGNAKGRQSGLREIASPSGRFSLSLPTGGLQVRSEDYPTAGEEQLREALELRAGDDVLVRIEAFANPRKQDASAWLDAELAALRDAAARQGPVKPLPRGATGRLLEIDRSPQSYARHIIALATPTLRLTLACEDAADPRARAALRAALAGLHLQRKGR